MGRGTGRKTWLRSVGLLGCAALVATLMVVAPSAGAGAQITDPPVIDDPGGIGEVDPFTPFVTIDWTMPDRYDQSPALDLDDRGDTIDPPQPWSDATYRQYLRPDRWRVDLTATISNAFNFGTPATWEWQLVGDDGSTYFASGQNPIVLVDQLGTYQTTLTVTDTGGATLTRTQEVSVDDLLVAVVGDSLNSGEGNPDVPGSFPDDVSQWVDADCDRSRLSGAALAAKDLEDRDPRTSVTFVNVACTGAWSTSLTGLGHPGVLNDNVARPPQLRDLAAALCHVEIPGLTDPAYPFANNATPTPSSEDGFAIVAGSEGPFEYDCSDEPDLDRPIDAMIMSVGVNDIGFRDVILGCADLDFSATDLLFPPTGNLAGWADEVLTSGTFTALFDLLPPNPFTGGCDEDEAITDKIDDGTFITPDALNRAAAAIEASGLVAEDGVVVHYAYPTDAIASLQRIEATTSDIPPFVSTTCDGTAFARLAEDELRFLNQVNRDLNDRIADLAETNGWIATPDGYNDVDAAQWWSDRGYCSGATDRAFVTLAESIGQYNNEIVAAPTDEWSEFEIPFTFGILHPDESGQDRLRQDAYNEIVARSPKTRPVTDQVTLRIDSLTITDTAALSLTEADLDAFETATGRFDVARTSPDEPITPANLLPYRLAQSTDVDIPLNWTELDPAQVGGLSDIYRVDVNDRPVLDLFGEPVEFDLDFSNVIEPDGSRETLRLGYQLSLPSGTGETICFEVPFDPLDPLGGPTDPLAGSTLRSALAPIGPGPGGGGPGPVECIPGVAGARSVVFDNQYPPGEPFGFYDPYPGQVISDITWTAARGFGAGRSYRLVARYQPNTDGTLKAGGFEAVLEFSIFPRNEPAPTADAGGPYVADEASGSTLTLDASGSSAVGGGALDYEWTGPLVDALSGEGIDWTQPTVEIPAGDDLGPLAVTLTVTDPNGRSASDTTTVRVRNVAPTGDASLVVDGTPRADDDPSPIDEGTTVTMEITCEDPGDDTHTVEIRWWNDFAPAEEVPCPPGGGVTVPFTFDFLDDSSLADDGTFPVSVRITDDDGGTGVEDWQLDVDNVDPSIDIGGPLSALPAGDAVLRRPGESTDLSVLVTDPGSEGLLLDWGFTTATAANPSGPEPTDEPSPGPTAPATLSDTQTIGASGPGVTTVPVTARDDDGGTTDGETTILTTGDLTRAGGASFWWRVMTGRADPFSPAELQGVLDVVSWASVEFEGLTPDVAAGILRNGDTTRDLLRMATLKAWLDVAGGVRLWAEPAASGFPAVGELITTAESILADPAATNDDLVSATNGANLV